MLRGDLENVRVVREFVGKRVDCVRVVPDQAEVWRGGLHGAEALDGLGGVGDAGGVAEDRHRPHALHLRILHQFLDEVHVGAGRGHRHLDHLEAEVLDDGEVAVVARHRADPLDGLLVLPGARRIVGAPDIGKRDEVEHDAQARGITRDDVLRGDAEGLGPELADVRNAVEVAVVAHVSAGLVGVVVRPRQRQQRVREPELLCGRLATRQVQVEVSGLEFLVLCASALGEFVELGCVQVLERHHHSRCSKANFACPPSYRPIRPRT